MSRKNNKNKKEGKEVKPEKFDSFNYSSTQRKGERMEEQPHNPNQKIFQGKLEHNHFNPNSGYSTNNYPEHYSYSNATKHYSNSTSNPGQYDSAPNSFQSHDFPATQKQSHNPQLSWKQRDTYSGDRNNLKKGGKIGTVQNHNPQDRPFELKKEQKRKEIEIYQPPGKQFGSKRVSNQIYPNLRDPANDSLYQDGSLPLQRPYYDDYQDNRVNKFQRNISQSGDGAREMGNKGSSLNIYGQMYPKDHDDEDLPHKCCNFEPLKFPCGHSLGLIHALKAVDTNYSYITCPHCNEKYVINSQEGLQISGKKYVTKLDSSNISVSSITRTNDLSNDESPLDYPKSNPIPAPRSINLNNINSNFSGQAHDSELNDSRNKGAISKTAKSFNVKEERDQYSNLKEEKDQSSIVKEITKSSNLKEETPNSSNSKEESAKSPRSKENTSKSSNMSEKRKFSNKEVDKSSNIKVETGKSSNSNGEMRKSSNSKEKTNSVTEKDDSLTQCCIVCQKIVHQAVAYNHMQHKVLPLSDGIKEIKKYEFRRLQDIKDEIGTQMKCVNDLETTLKVSDILIKDLSSTFQKKKENMKLLKKERLDIIRNLDSIFDYKEPENFFQLLLLKKESESCISQGQHWCQKLQAEPPWLVTSWIKVSLGIILHNAQSSEKNAYVEVGEGSSKRFARLALQGDRILLSSFDNYLSRTKKDFLIHYNQIDQIFEKKASIVYMKLSLGGKSEGLVIIRINTDTFWGKQFVLLCTGKNGPSYCNSNFFRVCWKGQGGHHIWGGDYSNNDGSGGETVLKDDVPLIQSHSAIIPGLVAARFGHEDRSTIFRIYVKEAANCHENFAFGQVEAGLDLLYQISDMNDITKSVITETGLVCMIT